MKTLFVPRAVLSVCSVCFVGALSAANTPLTNVQLSGANNTVTANSTLTVAAGGNLTISANATFTISANASAAIPTTALSGNITNSQLANSAITLAGTSVALGGNLTRDQLLGLSSTGLVARTSTNNLTIAAAGTDYVAPGPLASANLTIATGKLLGRTTAGNGTIETIVPLAPLSFASGNLSIAGNVTSSGLAMATAKILGRTTASSGAVEEIGIVGATLSGGNLTVSANVVGAASSTDNALVRMDGTGGKTVQNSNVTLADSGTEFVFSGAGGISAADNIEFTPASGKAVLVTGGTSGSFLGISRASHGYYYFFGMDASSNFILYDNNGTTPLWQLDQATKNVSLATTGATFRVKSGTNALAGTVTLASGNATITSTAIDGNTTFSWSRVTANGTASGLTFDAGSGNATVTGAATDNGTYKWIGLKVN